MSAERIVLEIRDHGSFWVDKGCTLLEACEAVDVPMESACGGFACCNSCRVEVLSGYDNLSSQSEEEAPFLDGPGQRLGCQAAVLGAVHVVLAPGM
jgi:ferredoxin